MPCRSISMLLVLALGLIHLNFVQSQPVTCSSNQPGTSCTTSSSCGAEHPPVGTSLEDYIRSTCDPSYGDTFLLPTSLDNQICPNYQHCDIASDDDESTKDEGRPKVHAVLETATVNRFNIHISWKPNVTSHGKRRGYQVQVFRNNGVFPVDCFCVNGKDAQNLTISGSNFLTFGHSDRLRVVVAPYPLPLNPFSQQAITGQYSIAWPRSCLDLGTDNCYPPTYPAPSNIQLHTSIYNTSEGVETRRLDIHWDAVMPNSSNSKNLSYYIQLRTLNHSSSVYFKVANDGCRNQLSVSLFPIRNHTHIYLQTHYPCAGLAELASSWKPIGCGYPSFKHTIPSPGIVTSYLPSSTPSLGSIVPTPLYSPPPASTQSGKFSLVTVTVPVVVLLFVLLVILTVLTILALKMIFRKSKPKFHADGLFICSVNSIQLEPHGKSSSNVIVIKELL